MENSTTETTVTRPSKSQFRQDLDPLVTVSMTMNDSVTKRSEKSRPFTRSHFGTSLQVIQFLLEETNFAPPTGSSTGRSWENGQYGRKTLGQVLETRGVCCLTCRERTGTTNIISDYWFSLLQFSPFPVPSLLSPSQLTCYTLWTFLLQSPLFFRILYPLINGCFLKSTLFVYYTNQNLVLIHESELHNSVCPQESQRTGRANEHLDNSFDV